MYPTNSSVGNWISDNKPESAMIYMIAYILGFAIPFFVLSFFITKMSWIKRNSMAFMKVGGYIMIVMGVFYTLTG